MGDMADYHLEQIFAELAHGYDGPVEDEIDEGKRCKYCGNRGFHWSKQSGRWRLTTRTGVVHKCKAYDKLQDFEVREEGEPDMRRYVATTPAYPDFRAEAATLRELAQDAPDLLAAYRERH